MVHLRCKKHKNVLQLSSGLTEWSLLNNVQQTLQTTQTIIIEKVNNIKERITLQTNCNVVKKTCKKSGIKKKSKNYSTTPLDYCSVTILK